MWTSRRATRTAGSGSGRGTERRAGLSREDVERDVEALGAEAGRARVFVAGLARVGGPRNRADIAEARQRIGSVARGAPAERARVRVGAARARAAEVRVARVAP